MSITHYLLLVFLTSFIYTAGKLIAILYYGLHGKAYQIGYSPRLFTLRLSKIELGIGIIIPLPLLFKVYALDEQTREKISSKNVIEYHEKPIYQRLLAVSGGFLCLLIVSMCISGLIHYHNPATELTVNEVNKHGVLVSPLAEELGFKKGDQLLKINNTVPHLFKAFMDIDLLNAPNAHILVAREGKQLAIKIPDDFLNRLAQEHTHPLFSSRLPFTIDQVIPNSPADQAGLVQDDMIFKANETNIHYFDELQTFLDAHKDSNIVLTVLHEGAEKPVTLTSRVDERGKLGIVISSQLVYEAQQVSITEAMIHGISYPYQFIKLQIRGLSKVLKGSAVVVGGKPTVASANPTITGPIGIAAGGLGDDNNSWLSFWKLVNMAIISLLFFDLIPLPFSISPLIFLLIYEAISKKPSNPQRIQAIRSISYYVILVLIVLVFASDLIQLLL